MSNVDVWVEVGSNGGEVDGDAGGGLLGGEGMDSVGGGERCGGEVRRGGLGAEGEGGEEEQSERGGGAQKVAAGQEVERGISPFRLLDSREL